MKIVLARALLAVKRYHDNGSSYKGNHLIGGCLRIKRINSLLSWPEKWRYVGRHNAGN